MSSLSSSLDRVDWNFPGAGTTANTVHSGRFFPGNFIPQIPAALISVLSTPGDVVLDPFSGSGTTGVEALALGRDAICSDRISSSVRISAAKIKAFREPPSEKAKQDFISAFAWQHLCETDELGLHGEGGASELSRWIAPGTLARLRYIWKKIERCEGGLRALAELVFGDVLFAAASPGQSVTATGKQRKHHWGWIADNVLPKALVEHDPIELFLRKLLSFPTQTLRPRSEGCSALVIQQDARTLSLPASSVNLVVTSPPYIGMIDYVRANRILYLWHGWPMGDDQPAEIGARYRRFRHAAEDEYRADMQCCWSEIHRVLRTDGYLAVVIGESRKFVGTVDRTLADLSELMTPVWGPTERVPTRRRVSERGARDPSEFVSVYQKR